MLRAELCCVPAISLHVTKRVDDSWHPRSKTISIMRGAAYDFRWTKAPVNGYIPAGQCSELQEKLWSFAAERKIVRVAYLDHLGFRWTSIGGLKLLTKREKRKMGVRASSQANLHGTWKDSSISDVQEQGSRSKYSESKRKRGKKAVPNSKAMHLSGHWRIFGVEVAFEKDPGKDDFSVSDALLESLAECLMCRSAQLPITALLVVRKSLDARKEPKFVYTIDIDAQRFIESGKEARIILSKLRVEQGKAEFTHHPRIPVDLVARLQVVGGTSQCESHVSSSELADSRSLSESSTTTSGSGNSHGRTWLRKTARVVVVGSGPAGLFAALTLAETGVGVVLLERGQPVESRGRDIGALMVRRLLNPNSNLCYGEGGAGTWSDGKLTTRIGKNSSSVQTILATLVRFGAPAHILVDGKPHIGTNKLVRILQQLRAHLHDLGVDIRFGTKMDDLEVHAGRVTGVHISNVDGKSDYSSRAVLEADAVVLGVGHSARDVYEMLLHHNVSMTRKPFAVGFRIEHPQELINELQYHRFSSEVLRGKGRLPVADYKLAVGGGLASETNHMHQQEVGSRGCFSFCMCPGGQVVLTSTSPSELCVNGMSFSNRGSRWANAALVVSVSASDLSTLVGDTGELAGVTFQRAIEQEAAIRGGGNFVAPVQTVTDFLDDRLSGEVLPLSSYRLGVKEASLHDLMPSPLTESLKHALLSFERQLPGFIDKRALLHGVETRTSSPVRIERHNETFESVSLGGLYPIGEGAGYAGGIVSAAVDGMRAGLALAKQLCLSDTALQDLELEG